MVLKTCLAAANCALSGRRTGPPIAEERASQPVATAGSAAARTEPKSVPAANAPAAPRRNRWREISCVTSRIVDHVTTKAALPHEPLRDGDRIATTTSASAQRRTVCRVESSPDSVRSEDGVDLSDRL